MDRQTGQSHFALNPGGKMEEIGLATRMGQKLDADRQPVP